MSAFLTSLNGEWIDDDRFELHTPLCYRSDLLEDAIVIPEGFVTDFASVPRVPVIYMLFGDRAHHESVPHDFIYQTHKYSKQIADKLFLEAMTVRGKPWYVRYPMYEGVVLGGQSSYNSGPSRFLILNKGAITK